MCGEWISVKDKLPSINDKVVGHFSDDFRIAGFYGYGKDYDTKEELGFWYWSELFCDARSGWEWCNPPFWMPIAPSLENFESEPE